MNRPIYWYRLQKTYWLISTSDSFACIRAEATGGRNSETHAFDTISI